ncbi:LPS biosynthesis protein WbpP [candidate division KSB1 bacterium]|nr:MAG: LPS biosynthesis protein WbpP [candidate division KSB1 bacterium]
MKTYLVTGGAGFIGSHIVETLVKRGAHVRVLDNFSTGKRENLQLLNKKIELIEGDIRDRDIVSKAVTGVDYVLHQAALGSVPRSIENPAETNEVNVSGTLNLLLLAQSAGVKRFVLASSSSVYGDTPTLPKHENMPLLPLSPYATSKLAAECYALNFYHIYHLPVVCLRYFNVFGPRQDPASQYAAVIPRFIEAFSKNNCAVVYGDGEQTRDFTYVENVVRANLSACTSEAAIGKAINIACGTRHSLNELLQSLQDIFKRKIEVSYMKAKLGDVRDSLAAIERARNLLGYEVRVQFREGLQHTVQSTS